MTSPSQLARYFQEAALLRSCLAFNRIDFEFANRGGRIVYLLDANIVRFFVSPEHEARHILPFHADRRPDYAEATALITAEFLLSRSLAGQMGGPALIAPSHGGEIGDILSAIKRDAQQHRPEDEPPLQVVDQKQAMLRDLVGKLDRADIDRRRAVQELEQLVPDLAKLLMSQGFQASGQMLRLYNEDLLRPLALHAAATRDILYPDADQVRAWEKQITRHRKVASRKDHEKVRNDAEALVQVMLLDRAQDDDRTDPDDPGTWYVLVSADQALHDAYVEWYWNTEPSERGRFVLRRPLQYTPILNALEMPNGIETAQLTERASAALDSLLSRHEQTDPQFIEKLLWYRLMSRTGGEAAESVKLFFGPDLLALDSTAAEQFDNFRELWHTSFRTGVVLNTRLMNRRRSEFDFLANVLGANADLRTLIYEHQERNLERIEAAHTVFTTRLNLRSLIHGQHRDGLAHERHRAELLIRVQFPEVFGGRPLREALRDLATDPQIATDVEQALQKEDSQAFFLAACVAHRCGQWASATLYAHRARELMAREIGADDGLGEVAFLHASALRYALAAGPMGDELRLNELRDALVMLDEAVADCDFRGDVFGGARALSEIGSLILFSIYYRWLGGIEPDEQILKQLAAFRPNALRAQELLALAEKVTNPNHSPEMIDAIGSNLIANVLSAGVLARVATPNARWAHLINPSDEGFAAAIELIGREDPDDPGYRVMAAENVMALRSFGRISIAQAKADMERLIAAAAKDTSTLAMDLAEMRRFQRLLAEADVTSDGSGKRPLVSRVI